MDTTKVRKQAEKNDAVVELKYRGAELLKQEDRFGDTKTGWWLDGVYLAPTNDPVAALNAIKGG